MEQGMIAAIEMLTGILLTQHNSLGQVVGVGLLGALTLSALLLALHRLRRSVRQPEAADYSDDLPSARSVRNEDVIPPSPPET
jgi:hypothetical protein